MANISFLYPERRKGFALGLNAPGGNLGVAVVGGRRIALFRGQTGWYALDDI